jgi:hypothetical protein
LYVLECLERSAPHHRSAWLFSCMSNHQTRIRALSQRSRGSPRAGSIAHLPGLAPAPLSQETVLIRALR